MASTISPTTTLNEEATKGAPSSSEKVFPEEASLSKDAALPPVTPESAILTGKKLAVVFAAMLMSLLLVALDQTILATALPRIASDFNAFSLQGWVSSAFILTQAGFLLWFGQLLRIYPAKHVLLGCIALFELGSVVCGAAPNVYALIVGRAISGVGASGLFVALIQIISQVTHISDRPKLFGLFGAVFGLSTVIGPLIGGAFTDHVSWRWCFYINLPVGAVTLVAVSFLLKAAPPLGADLNERSPRALIRQTLRMDWIGAVLVFAAVTCLMLALQWGGNEKPWSSPAVIVCFVVAGVLVVAIVGWERYLGHAAMIPTGVFKSKSVVAVVIFNFLIRFTMLLQIYYLPIFYQAGRGVSATNSGISILPLMLGTVISIILAGQIVGRIGRYWHFLIVGPVPLAIGSGLLYTVNEHTSSAKLIGYQILAGVGIGMTMQNGLFAIQAEFRDTPKLLGQATSMASFGQFLGGAIGLAAGQALFSSQLNKNIAKYAPTAPVEVITQSPTAIRTSIPADQIAAVITAYVKSLNPIFIIGVPTAALCMICAMFIKNISIKKPKEEAKEGEEAAKKEEALKAAKETV